MQLDRMFLLVFVISGPAMSQQVPRPSPVVVKTSVKTDPVRVAVYDDLGSPRTASDFKRVFGNDPKDFQLTFVTAEQIRSGALKKADVLVQGGGGAQAQSDELQASGRDAIREFVRTGGGYLGICAGAYLASSAKTSDLGIMNSRVVDSAHWARGRGDVELGFTPVGQQEIGESKPKVTVMYHQGPLLAPAERKDLPVYTEVAKFNTEVAEKGAPHGVMQGTTALASSTFGQGRVFVISPHPEQTAGQEGIVRGALLWAAGRTR